MANGARPTTARTHRWYDEAGTLAFEHNKKPDGRWSYRHPVEGNRCPEHKVRTYRGYCPKKPAIARELLWNMRDLCDALDDGQDVGWCAGEKDANNLGNAEEHAVCTSVHQGESSGTYPEQAELFRDAESEVTIYVDDDKAGWRNGIDRYEALIAVGLSEGQIRLRLPAEGCNDVSDHLGDAQARSDGWREVTVDYFRRMMPDDSEVDSFAGGGDSAELLAVAHAALKAAGSKPASSGQDWTCPHPRHKDNHPSFGVMVGASGSLVFNCQGSTCMPEKGTAAHKKWFREVLKALKLTPADIKPGGVKEYSWDDFGNAERLVDAHGNRVRWVRDAAVWAVYGGDGAWKVDANGNEVGALIRQVIIDMCDPLGVEAQSYSASDGGKGGRGKPEASSRDKFLKWAKTQRFGSKVDAARKSVGYHPGCERLDMEEFDANPWSLNVLNGVVDLRTGALTEHSESRLLMKQSRLRYDPNARCPEWEKFIDWAHPDDDQLWYLQKVLGYSTTGDMGEQTYWTHHGYGNNGKSVTFRVMNAVLGAYAHDLPPKALTARRNDAHPTELADIAGKRLLMVSELAVGARYDDAIIKSITGQEPLTARHMRQDNFTFKPIGKIHFLVNSLPGSDGGNAMERRARTVPWTQTRAEGEIDRFLAERIIEHELSGVLNWLIAGVAGWAEEGLGAPTTVAGATKEHIRGGDTLWAWIDDCLEPEADEPLSHTVLYDSYKDWCEENRTKPMTGKAFGNAILERNFLRIGRMGEQRRIHFSGYRILDTGRLHTGTKASR